MTWRYKIVSLLCIVNDELEKSVLFGRVVYREKERCAISVYK